MHRERAPLRIINGRLLTWWLVLVAVGFTALNFLLVPLLGLKNGTAAQEFPAELRR